MAGPAYVVDSSVFASLVVKDEFYSRASEFLREKARLGLATVDLALVEVANALWKHAYLLRRIPEGAYPALKDCIKPLISSAASIYRSEELLEEALDRALELGLTVYDSLYVELALELECRLATFDEVLVERLEGAGLGLAVVP